MLNPTQPSKIPPRPGPRRLLQRAGACAGGALLALSGCSADDDVSRLVGSMSLTVDDGSGTPTVLTQAGPPGELRVQIDDYGTDPSDIGQTGCDLEGQVDTPDGPALLTITTYPDEVKGLLAGQAQTVAASDHTTLSIALNAATLYITQGSDIWYTTGGTLGVPALPAPMNNLHIVVNVTGQHLAPGSSTGTPVTITGTIDATYIGADRLVSTQACPALADVPSSY